MALNMVVPGHINFHSFLLVEMAEKGFHYIKDRSMNYLVHTEHKEYGKLKHSKNVFEYDAKNEFDFNRIVQFNMEGFDVDSYIGSLSKSNTSISEVEGNSPDAVKDT
jgi:hypothetical protein